MARRGGGTTTGAVSRVAVMVPRHGLPSTDASSHRAAVDEQCLRRGERLDVKLSCRAPAHALVVVVVEVDRDAMPQFDPPAEHPADSNAAANNVQPLAAARIGVVARNATSRRITDANSIAGELALFEQRLPESDERRS